MTNVNRINGKQKMILADFMTEHPDLAKNRLNNCPQAKATSKRLWEQLSNKLNSSGPPIKNCSSWKKVFADQKHSVKKKLSFNRSSMKKTGGGPYEEKLLTAADEQILEAAGLNAAVEGLLSVESFGSKGVIENECTEIFISQIYDDIQKDKTDEEPVLTPKRRVQKGEEKLTLLKENIDTVKDWQKDMCLKMDKMIELKEIQIRALEDNNNKQNRIIALKEKSLCLKEAEHKSNMAVKQIDLQIKRLELEALQQKLCSS